MSLDDLTEQEESELLDKMITDGNVRMRAIGVMARFFADSGMTTDDLPTRMKSARALIKAMTDADLATVVQSDLRGVIASVAQRAREKERRRAGTSQQPLP